MNALRDRAPATDDLAADVEAACGRVAPTWPLDRLIAVNPLWGFVDLPFAEAATRTAALGGSRLTMPRSWYREGFATGRFRRDDVARAIDELGAALSVDEALDAMAVDRPPPSPRRKVTDAADRVFPAVEPWPAFVVDEVSRACAAFFDAGQASVRGLDDDLYVAWREAARLDRGPELRAGLTGHRRRVDALPDDAWTLVRAVVEQLGVPRHERSAYLTSLLLDVGGWAAWCAGRRWQARLAGGDDTTLVGLLAVRLAWELLLLDAGGDALASAWAVAVRSWPRCDERARRGEVEDQVLQRAAELAAHRPIVAGLRRAPAVTPDTSPPAVQAVFCIDVRSEVLRRALEHVAPEVRTRGFAGFFGLPVDYAPAAGTPRPHLPGLLAPKYRVVDAGLGEPVAARRDARLRRAVAWKRLRHGALTGFAFVEALGPLFAPKLLSDAFGLTRPVPTPSLAGLTADDDRARAPRLVSTVDGAPLPDEERASLAAGMLRAMGLTSGFARLVLLCGHGSRTTNNPHAAGLHCGACCGRSGEVNARAAAALLNDPAVRAGLGAQGVDVPDDTRFLAALHDTTTDEVTLLEVDDVPATHREAVAALARRLAAAGERARAERAGRLGLGGLTGASLRRAMERRARDWAEVRPEWGLAGNAAFVVAPRAHVAHLDLGGRAFLHDYAWRDDPDGSVLELLLTAPMVVTHWINLQYYASTLDPRRWGSGDKVLHDVVGGGLGVFEGNGGDLRIGLPLQSVHDGERWVHEPVRLGVFVEAPADAIDAVLARHPTVRSLVVNGWLHLHQWDGPGGRLCRRGPEGWVHVEA